MSNPQSTEVQSDKPSFESALEKLQLSVRRLESGELSLEDALKQFEEGVRLTRVCQEYLTAAETKIEILTKATTNESVQLQTFGSG